MAERPFIYRFIRDLRLDDHAGLTVAASHGNVLPLLVIDPALKARLARSPRRAAFFCAAAAALDGELRERGSRLIVRRGAPFATIKSVAAAANAPGVAWSASYDAETMRSDEQLRSDLEEAGLVASIVHDAPAVAPDESAAAHSVPGSGYRAFAAYFDVWRSLPVRSHEHPLLIGFVVGDLKSEPLPQAREFGSTAAVEEAGSGVAHRVFERFLREDAAHYAVAAVVPSEDRTSHLSAHLSFGTISARAVVRAIAERLEDPFSLSEERLSYRRFLRALAQRDFFLQLGWFYPRTRDEPLQERMRGFQWKRSHPALDAWREGVTGYPLVDAGIRQLAQTGWMHPVVRTVAASFLCFDLAVDWRVGRDHWDRWLIEDDAALATGNWQWIAGVGSDLAQYPRIYNPERQRRRHDPAGIYVRRWIPELRGVPVATWHGLAGDSPQLMLELFSEDAYARPVVEHERAGREFLARYRAFVSP